jgi:histidine triad (HIT) family protein
MNDNCIFCKIVKGEIPSTKIFEDSNFIAILDLFPNTKGQTVVISKKHIDSDILALTDPDFDYALEGLNASRTVANMLKNSLSPTRVALVTEGMEVNHMHIKLFPIYAQLHKIESKPEYFDYFPGYLTTKSGPQWSREELEGLAGVILSAAD